MSNIYFKSNGLQVSNGNRKLGNDTLILNMGTATNCPSAKLGLCKLGKKCYALKAERLYPEVLPCRTKQENYWLTSDADTIAFDLLSLLLGKRRRKAGKLQALGFSIKFIRFNESGDFHSQACVEKLESITKAIKKVFKHIEVYGYSARSDLDFTKVSFFCKGSGHDAGNHGRTIARHKKELMLPDGSLAAAVQLDGQAYKVCPGSCKSCKICKVTSRHNVVFPLH